MAYHIEMKMFRNYEKTLHGLTPPPSKLIFPMHFFRTRPKLSLGETFWSNFGTALLPIFRDLLFFFGDSSSILVLLGKFHDNQLKKVRVVHLLRAPISLKKEASPAVLGGRAILEML